MTGGYLTLSAVKRPNRVFYRFACARCSAVLDAPLGASEAWHRCSGAAGSVRALKGVRS